MGYYTRYDLETDSTNQQEIIDDLRAKYDSAKYAFDECGDSYDTTKWYDHEDELLAFSKGWPSTLFTLIGAGEEPGDLWKKYFKNGKLQRATGEIVYDEFDESKLAIPKDTKASLR